MISLAKPSAVVLVLAMLEKGSWNSFDLNAYGDWISAAEPTIHLICSTSGTIKGISAMVEATSIVNAGRFAGASS